MVVLEGDPFEDLDLLKQPQGVLARGVWLSRQALDAMLRKRTPVDAFTDSTRKE